MQGYGQCTPEEEYNDADKRRRKGLKWGVCREWTGDLSQVESSEVELGRVGSGHACECAEDQQGCVGGGARRSGNNGNGNGTETETEKCRTYRERAVRGDRRWVCRG